MTNLIHDRIIELLNTLKIKEAHVAARVASDWHGLAANHPDRVASLTLTTPTSMPTKGLEAVAPRLVVFSSDMVGFGDWTTGALEALPAAQKRFFNGYETPLWADVASDHGPAIETELLAQRDRWSSPHMQASDYPEAEGEVAGITFRISGRGEPLLLFPLGLAPSGWTDMVTQLSQHFCVILLGGPHLGVMPMLEERGQSPGYQSMMDTLLDTIQLQDGESVLEVGYGTGVLLRWLAARTGGKNHLTGVDLNDYLRDEARDLAKKEGLGEIISFEFGNAEELPFPDNSFDVIYSVTVMEEVNAAQMMSELVRVVKPGGRVGVIVRATDMHFKLNLPLTPEDLAPFQQLSPRQEGAACASASLYGYFQRSGLENVQFGPYLANFFNANGQAERYVVSRYISQLAPADTRRWEAAMRQADEDGTFFLAWPHHMAVGTKARA